MRLVSLAHDLKAIWQAKGGDRPCGPPPLHTCGDVSVCCHGVDRFPCAGRKSSEPVRTDWPKVGGFLECPRSHDNGGQHQHWQFIPVTVPPTDLPFPVLPASG